MKRWLLSLLVLSLFVTALPASAETTALVAYFSRAGENYEVGVIEEGNTAKVAKIIAAQLEADLFEIVPVEPYSSVYDETLEQAEEEQRTDARPAYVGDVEEWERYDTVFVGYPIWWGSVPNIVLTFLESHDFSGKTVIPFNTHAGSGQSHTQADIEAMLEGQTVKQGVAIRGSKAQQDAEGTAADIAAWLNELDLTE